MRDQDRDTLKPRKQRCLYSYRQRQIGQSDHDITANDGKQIQLVVIGASDGHHQLNCSRGT